MCSECPAHGAVAVAYAVAYPTMTLLPEQARMLTLKNSCNGAHDFMPVAPCVVARRSCLALLADTAALDAIQQVTCPKQRYLALILIAQTPQVSRSASTSMPKAVVVHVPQVWKPTQL